MAAVYRNYGDFTTPTPVPIGSRAFPNWGSTFAGDMGALVTQTRFSQLIIERTFASNAWVNSGAMRPNPAINVTTGSLVELPMVRPFKAAKEYVESNTTWGASGKGHLTVQKINADSAFSPIQQCAYAGGADDLSEWMSGVDPIAVMTAFISENMMRHTTDTSLALMDGLFSTGGPLAGKVVDITRTGAGPSTEANFLSAAALMRGKAVNGERGQLLTIAAMHSNVAYYLSTVGMLTFSTAALATGGNIAWGGGGVGITNTQVADMAGFRVVVDDALVPTTDAVNGDKYPVYLMEPGTLSTGIRNGLRVRYDTNILSFQNVIAVDWSMTMGIPGISWKGSSTVGEFPTDADFADPDNWENKLTDLKSVGAVKLLVNTPFAANP